LIFWLCPAWTHCVPLLQRFKFGAICESDELKVLGLNIIQSGKDIYINQGDYISKKIEYVDIKKNDEDTLSTQLSAEDKRLIWQAVGKCRWICDQTRPDICYDNYQLNRETLRTRKLNK